MKHWKKRASCLAAMALACGQAQAADAPACMTGEEVKAIALVLMPEALEATAKACAPVLPETALLRKADAPIFERYRTGTAPALERAQTAFARLAGVEGSEEINSLGLELMRAMIVPKLSAEIKQEDCGAINQMVELLEPLPPENMAGAIATILQIMAKEEAAKAGGKKKKDSGNGDNLNICPFGEVQ